MSSNTFTIAIRIINQLIRDRRTIALLVVAPLLIASIVGVSTPDKSILDYTAPAILAMLILMFGFLLTGINFLRERSQGTMERLMASPISRLDIVVGYIFGFLLFALLQTLIIFFYMVYVLKVNYRGDLWQILVFQVIIGIGAVCLGTFVSIFARNEFQVAQFIPIIILPQMFLCGVLWPIEQMPDYLQWVSKFLPLTYGVSGLRDIMLTGKNLLDVGSDLGILVGFAVVMSVAASLTMKGAPDKAGVTFCGTAGRATSSSGRSGSPVKAPAAPAPGKYRAPRRWLSAGRSRTSPAAAKRPAWRRYRPG